MSFQAWDDNPTIPPYGATSASVRNSALISLRTSVSILVMMISLPSKTKAFFNPINSIKPGSPLGRNSHKSGDDVHRERVLRAEDSLRRKVAIGKVRWRGQ